MHVERLEDRRCKGGEQVERRTVVGSEGPACKHQRRLAVPDGVPLRRPRCEAAVVVLAGVPRCGRVLRRGDRHCSPRRDDHQRERRQAYGDFVVQEDESGVSKTVVDDGGAGAGDPPQARTPTA